MSLVFAAIAPHGGLGGPARSEILSYQAPAYFGMLRTELQAR